MAESAVDLLIHLRQWDDVEQVGQIDADLSDGRYFSGRLRLDLQALQEAAHNHDLEQYGRLLHEALFDGVIGRAYDLAAGLAAGSNGGPLRFRLWVEPTAARLAALKWECLAHYHDTRLVPLSVRADTLFSRYTGLGIAEPQPVSQRPIHLLVAVANPANLEAFGLAPIDVAAEIQSLRDAVGDLARGGGLKVTFLPGQTGLDEALLADLRAAGHDVVSGPTSLEQILRRMREAHIVHLLSHGRFVGAGDNAGPALYLEAEEGERAGQVSPVTDRALVDRLRALDALPHLLFLAACESAKSDAEAAQVGLAPRLVQAGVPAVIAMQERVEIAAARQLAGDFYHEILRHGVVDRALNSARGLLFREQDRQWAVPVLFMRLRTGRLFTADPVRATLDAMAEHPAFRFFSPETSNYIPLPIEAVQVTTDQLAAEMESLSQESVATTEVLKAMVEALERSRVAEGPPDLVMLVGGFGTNKSTQLKNVVWQTIQSSLGTMGQSLIPLYVDLSNYYPDQAALDNPLEAYVLKQLARFWPDLQADRLEKLPENIRLRLLFYGLDQLAERDRAEALDQLLELKATFTTFEYLVGVRANAIDWATLKGKTGLRLLLIQPLSRVRIRQFLENLDKVTTFGGATTALRRRTGEKLLTRLYRSELFDLVATPWFMVMLLQWAERDSYPASRTEALNQLMQRGLSRLALGPGMLAHAVESICTLAWEMQNAEQQVWPAGGVFTIMAAVRGSRSYDLEALYDGLLRYGPLEAVGEQLVHFAYPAFQSYYGAQAILAREDRTRVLGRIVATLGMPNQLRWWEDTLVFTCGLLADAGEPEALEELLASIVYGADLLAGERVFLAARCFLECERYRVRLKGMRQHVISALRWRASSVYEARSPQRLRAIELLSRLADPSVILELARTMYDRVRTNLRGEEDYEYSSIRLAAAVGLKRMRPRQRVYETLAEIDPALPDLFESWRTGDFQALCRQYDEAPNPALQALAALAIGDLVSQSTLSQVEESRRQAGEYMMTLRAYLRLKKAFMDSATPHAVRWALSDALAMVNSSVVTEKVIAPALAEIVPAEAADSSRARCLAYLIGLMRTQQPAARGYLLDGCLHGTQDLRLWLTVFAALGRLGGQEDRQLLEEVATGTLDGEDLAHTFPAEADQLHLRRNAIDVLADLGTGATVDLLSGAGLGDDPALAPAFFQMASAIHWRRQ